MFVVYPKSNYISWSRRILDESFFLPSFTVRQIQQQTALSEARNVLFILFTDRADMIFNPAENLRTFLGSLKKPEKLILLFYTINSWKLCSFWKLHNIDIMLHIFQLFSNQYLFHPLEFQWSSIIWKKCFTYPGICESINKIFEVSELMERG